MGFMKHKLIIFLSTIILFTTCSEKKKVESFHPVDGKNLIKTVEEALWGSEKANFNLSGLVQPKTPSPDNLNRIFIDSTNYQKDKTLYSVLIESPNPLYNVLAVYDKNLDLYLQDNSLNGNISTKWQTYSDNKYLVASEDFLAKDFLKLSRISLYGFVNSKFYLLFRTFTKFDKAGEVYQQNLENIDSFRIVTHIIADKKSKLNNVVDTFYFNASKNKYVSSQDTFKNFIKNEINKADWKLEKPELLEATLEQPVKENDGNDKKDEKEESKVETPPQKNDVTVKPNGFQIWLNSDWKAPVSEPITEYLISRLDGFKYVNAKLGAQIMVIPLPEGSTSAQFVKYKFGKPSKGDYKVRQTDLMEIDNYQIQIFEHSCEQKSYLLLLKAPTQTYNKFKNLYNNIINSFFVEC